MSILHLESLICALLSANFEVSQFQEFAMSKSSRITIENRQLESLLTKDGPFPFEFAQQSEQPIYRVEHVQLTFLALNGPRIVLVSAYGATNTTGWSHFRLQPYIYVQPPPDGIWDFVFVADPPSGIALDVISHASATYVWTLGKSEFKGVRVHSATNTVERVVGDEAKHVVELKMNYRIGAAAA